MLVAHAKELARQWVVEHASNTPGFDGAFFHGSAAWLPDAASLPATSDLDVVVVLADPEPPPKPGKILHRDLLLDISHLSIDQLASPDLILGQSHLAGSFRTASVISDPSGRLTRLQAAVAKDFANRRWVHRRCERVEDKILAYLRRLDEPAPFPDQVVSWVFATGLTTHLLLVAGLQNPTVRRRYAAARDLLADYGRLAFHDTLLELLGCAATTKIQVEHHLVALATVFDVAAAVIKTPFSFASDISQIARPLAIDGSRELIARGDHREAIFWMVVTYSRCQTVLAQDAPPEMQARFEPEFRELLGDVGIASFADLRRRGDRVKSFLPRVWEVADGIMATNREIEDERRTDRDW